MILYDKMGVCVRFYDIYLCKYIIKQKNWNKKKKQTYDSKANPANYLKIALYLLGT